MFLWLQKSCNHPPTILIARLIDYWLFNKTKTNKHWSLKSFIHIFAYDYLVELKHIFLILALTGVLFQNFTKIIIYANFELNRDYIAKNICVKKDIPDNSCKGSCHLKKQLDDEEKREQAPPVRNLKEVKEFQLFCEQRSPFEFTGCSFTPQLFTPYQFSELNPPSFSIFHPPQCWLLYPRKPVNKFIKHLIYYIHEKVFSFYGAWCACVAEWFCSMQL